MARILLQTTIPYAQDDWHAGRFSLLREELTAAGHTLTARGGGVLTARVVARGRSMQSGRAFNIAVVTQGEPGRAIAESTFHHFCDPQRLAIFKDYVRNIARWLSA